MAAKHYVNLKVVKLQKALFILLPAVTSFSSSEKLYLGFQAPEIEFNGNGKTFFLIILQ